LKSIFRQIVVKLKNNLKIKFIFGPDRGGVALRTQLGGPASILAGARVKLLVTYGPPGEGKHIGNMAPIIWSNNGRHPPTK
jgi:hypothetical protein